MKKAFMLIELLISVFLVVILMSILTILLINLNTSGKTEIIQEIINRSEAGDYDQTTTLNNGLRLETVSQNGYVLEYLR